MKRTPRNRTATAGKLAQDMAQAMRRAVFDAILHAANEGYADDGGLTVPPADEPRAPALLAEAHPEAHRAPMRTLYERCLQHYRQVVGDGPGTPDDACAAVAHFVAANMQALHDVEVTPAMLLSLHRQLAGVARLSSRWDQASQRDRQLFFEKMAVIAVLVDQTWTWARQHGGEAGQANVKRGARGYLRELLGFDPDRLMLSDRGLSVAPAAVAA